MWFHEDELWMGTELVRVIGDHEDAAHPTEQRTVKDGDTLKLIDALNGNGYYIGPNHRTASIELQYLVKVKNYA